MTDGELKFYFNTNMFVFYFAFTPHIYSFILQVLPTNFSH